MNQARSSYPSDLTDQQWELIRPLIPAARSGGRPRTTNIRSVVNAILYLTRTGCAWRYLPRDYPPYKTVYDYFSKWNYNGVWRKIHLSLVKQVRLAEGRNPSPSTVIIDAQSVRAQYGEARGWDGFKKVRGRKREILVDTMGMIWGTTIHPANTGENRHAFEAVMKYPTQEKPPARILGDSAYSKPPFDHEVFFKWKIWPEIRKGNKIKYKDSRSRIRYKVDHSNLKPQRWIVERSFAWFNNFRRLNRDYERNICYAENFLYISQIPLLLNRLVI
jgi:putative transposase